MDMDNGHGHMARSEATGIEKKGLILMVLYIDKKGTHWSADKYCIEDDGTFWDGEKQIFPTRDESGRANIKLTMAAETGEKSRKSISFSRLVFCTVFGHMDNPANDIDHLDGNPANDDPSNLAELDPRTNEKKGQIDATTFFDGKEEFTIRTEKDHGKKIIWQDDQPRLMAKVREWKTNPDFREHIENWILSREHVPVSEKEHFKRELSEYIKFLNYQDYLEYIDFKSAEFERERERAQSIFKAKRDEFAPFWAQDKIDTEKASKHDWAHQIFDCSELSGDYYNKKPTRFAALNEKRIKIFEHPAPDFKLYFDGKEFSQQEISEPLSKLRESRYIITVQTPMGTISDGYIGDDIDEALNIGDLFDDQGFEPQLIINKSIKPKREPSEHNGLILQQDDHPDDFEPIF